MGQVDLFGAADVPVVDVAPGRPVWTSLTGIARRTMCDHCVIATQSAGSFIGAPKRATQRRTLDGTTTCLCSQHAQDQRERDALTPTKGN